MLVSVENKSIIVIEDIDCTIDPENRTANVVGTKPLIKKSNQVNFAPAYICLFEIEISQLEFLREEKNLDRINKKKTLKMLKQVVKI